MAPCRILSTILNNDDILSNSLVYIRSKKIKGIEYAYLVHSVWDEKLNTSRQKTIKYLGKVSHISIDSIPKEFQDIPNVRTFLVNHNIENKINVQKEHTKIRKIFFNLLIDGNLEGAIDVYDTYSKSLHLSNFYDYILKIVMYEIGDLWKNKKLEIAQEHVASNTANSFVKTLTERTSASQQGCKIVICTPEGEWHNLGCNVLQSVLQNKGFKVFNISPSLPHDSVVNYILDVKPDAVFISVTLAENLSSCKRLIHKIESKSSVPIAVGGLAVKEMKDQKLDAIVSTDDLDSVSSLVKTMMKNQKKPKPYNKKS
ncbi:Response regulator receiver protein [Nitrosotalea sinensis]|uniref:Response regulator receiver protein n=1 Tax=Nitrosotalea sinensis TaxID=1499975 RepID=A0A2H1EGA5_9ARCH|nr:Response regulator receiver protein [Candidatus Nitrosotalea sinensis]